jgi:hypothetical protein
MDELTWRLLAIHKGISYFILILMTNRILNFLVAKYGNEEIEEVTSKDKSGHKKKLFSLDKFQYLKSH